jgi:hypothetical protein
MSMINKMVNNKYRTVSSYFFLIILIDICNRNTSLKFIWAMLTF